MSEKSLRRRAMQGEQVLGSMVFEFFSPGIAQILKLAGCEFVLYDMEHTGMSLETLKTQVAACRGLGIAPMVRVPRGEYHFLARALDVGAQGLMIPMVESKDHALRIVEATRYPPKGRRGAAFGFPHDDYAPGDPLGKIGTADERNLVIAQIETERGLAAVEEIAAVDGIDVLWVGHFDLTNFLGIPGRFDHPEYLDAVRRVVDAGRAHKKGLGFMPSDEAWAQAYKAHGFNMLAAGTDQALLMAGIKRILQSVGGKA
ncbi:MAG: hpch/hpai aldolase [Hyphomicrobiaceae bacterium]|nr:hpch/hpai aldolase [Hyphomicrobiaceae bacterium]